MAIQLLIGHTCHHLSQSNGITIDPSQAPKSVAVIMTLADRSSLFILREIRRSRMCVNLGPQNKKSGTVHSNVNSRLNVVVPVTDVNGAPNTKANP